ncbi:methyltransferase-containing protein [Coleophoma cylindrospora]|uniref:Methyltransferase-containing protein n=1 Tax=Coleophoma cylindrospora TaxID=1849047 RepID=A0A3D8RUW0_9HELO|nr:methyltransferase-containing protein [Coleophoma cylindrospora]
MASATSSTHNLEIEVDDTATPANPYDDHGEVFEGSLELAASTASAKSSIFRFQVENGRTYHAYKAGKYILPNDEAENNRLDLQSHLCYMTLNRRLYLAPLGDNVKRVLDVGTGTGIWAINYADEHPDVEVIGMDLSPVQPLFVPTNLMFEIDDLEESWTFSSKFDYIHAGMMCGSFHNWPKFYQQSFDNLNSGGYLEIMDIGFPVRCDDDTMPKDCALYQWCIYIKQAADNVGVKLDACLHAKEDMHRAGFVDVVEIPYKWPQNRWPKQKKFKELGMWTSENFNMGLEGMSLALLTRGLGWSLQEVNVLCAHTRLDMANTGIHAYWPIVTIYGRKP